MLLLLRRCCSFGNFHCQCVFLLVQSRWGQTTEKRLKQLLHAGLKESADWSISGWSMSQSHSHLNFYFRIKAFGLTGALQQFLQLISSLHILTGLIIVVQSISTALQECGQGDHQSHWAVEGKELDTFPTTGATVHTIRAASMNYTDCGLPKSISCSAPSFLGSAEQITAVYHLPANISCPFMCTFLNSSKSRQVHYYLRMLTGTFPRGLRASHDFCV